MNLQLLNLGTVANDRTGDTLRDGGGKINGDFQELFFFSAARHRQTALVYKITNNLPDFLSFSGLSLTLAAPFVASIAGLNDGRGERNLGVFVQTLAANAWTVPDNTTCWIFISSAPNTGAISYGFSQLEPANQQTEPAQTLNQYWYDTLAGSVKKWNGSAWIQVYVVFLAKLTTAAGAITSLTYLLDNDEVLMARAEATKAAIVLG